MELSFNELKKREVINVVDGKSLGYITDLTLSFPSGTLTGITVPERKLNCFLRMFNKTEVFIPTKNILKIGNDVILVNLKCGETCGDSIGVGAPPPKPCPSPCPPQPPKHKGNCLASCEDILGSIRADDEDY